MTTFNTISIIGAGAIGCYYGGRLAQHNRDVHFLLRSDYRHVRANGLRIKSIDGDFDLPPGRLHVYDDSAAMPRSDLVIVTLKTTGNDQLHRLIAPLVHDDTTILTLQNGLGNEDELARLFGAQRVLGGIAFTCINRTAPGVIEHIDYGLIRIGEFAQTGLSDRITRIAEMFNSARVPCEPVENLLAARWDKLVWNIPFNGLGAMLDCSTDRLIGSEAGVAVVRAVMDEVMRCANADGVFLGSDLPQKKIDMTFRVGAYRTSMQLDRLAGREMEIDSILARPMRIGNAKGVATPLIGLLCFALSAQSR